MKREKVCIFAPSLQGGGAERVIATLAEGFSRRGYAVDLVLARAEGPFLKEVPDSVNIIDLGARRVATSLFGLVRYLRSSKPSVILSTHAHANITAIIAVRFSKSIARLVIREANTLSLNARNSARLRDRFIPMICRKTYRSAAQVIAPSEGVARDLIELDLADARQIVVVYSPAVSERFKDLGRKTPRHPWFNPKIVPVVISTGRLTKQKDYGCLIEAFSLAIKVNPMRLIILGEGEERANLECMVRRKSLEDCIHLPGFVENPFNFMNHADLFALSSVWEGLPNSLIQAMSFGTPVVATDCPSGPAEILDGGRVGTLVPVANPCALAEGMLAELAKGGDKEYRRSLSARSLLFSEDVIVQKYLEVLYPDLRTGNGVVRS